ncbi:hypothetical protein L3Q82_012527 [Scortum barcoo]|uniref:Uncharacterized protein n=1 Tax=Scortum barcoo TaxID=214431 RepID=A0ACB8W3F9_9TELE|nr:hypothetical protein L3Q82_012527 [Scortum barcoo]
MREEQMDSTQRRGNEPVDVGGARETREMVSKEPNHLLTGQTNGKSTLADKLPGTMTVRSVLLNRDSPDIESRLKRRRNRTHQVRFKDLEDGSSSSGNSGTGENNSHQRPAKDCDSPHPLRKHSSRSPQPWTDTGMGQGLRVYLVKPLWWGLCVGIWQVL